MKFKCKAFKNNRFNVLVVPLGAGKTLTFNEVGQVLEADIPEKQAYELMAQYDGMLEMIKEVPKKTVTPPENKMASPNRRK